LHDFEWKMRGYASKFAKIDKKQQLFELEKSMFYMEIEGKLKVTS